MCITHKITPKAEARYDNIVFKAFEVLFTVRKWRLGNAYYIAGKKNGKIEFTIKEQT